MLRFPKIKLLFDTFSGFDTKDIFIITLIITIFSIVKSLVNFIHAKRYPVEPSILGKILQFTSLTIIVSAKVVLISTALLNAVYLHLFLHMANIVIIYLLYIRVYDDKEDLFNYMTLINLFPTFYSPPSEKNSFREIVMGQRRKPKRFRIVEKLISPMILYAITFGIYCVTGLILRETMFNYNIKLETREVEGFDYFKKYVIEFPVLEIMGFYAAAVFMHIAISSIYYRVGHPWKILIWSDRSESINLENVIPKEEEDEETMKRTEDR